MLPVPRLFLIDSFGFIFRAYHARARSGAPPMRTSSGLSTEAVFIFHNMVRKLITSFKPDYIAAVFESSEPTFRSETFAEYKANRTEMPHDLGQQIPYIRRLLEAMQMPILQFPAYEADDVIGAIACREPKKSLEVVIVSSDKDMLQLVNQRVFMLNPMKDDEWYDEAKTEQFMGVKPSQVADLLALKGDSIDNIPGAPGIGDKGARELIARFGSVESLLDRASEVERKMYRESLLNNRKQIELSKQLATIHTQVPIEWDLESLRTQPFNNSALKAFYKELEFFSLLKDLPAEDDSATRDYAALSDAAAVSEWLAARPAAAPLAVALDLTNSFAGLAYHVGIGRAMPLSLPRIAASCARIGRHSQNCSRLQSVPVGRCFARHRAKECSGRCDALRLPAERRSRRLFARSSGRAIPRPQTECRCRAAGRGNSGDCGNAAAAARPAGTRPCLSRDRFAACSGARTHGKNRYSYRFSSPVRIVHAPCPSALKHFAQKVYDLAGHPFNINSPQQLGKVLFEEMNLPSPVKYGKGKVVSTAADVLEGLAAAYPVAQHVLDYRQLTKLKGTYIDALPLLIRRETGRLHTTFNQAGAATGRLSSSNPNLQNIPIRTEEGREIRVRFRA